MTATRLSVVLSSWQECSALLAKVEGNYNNDKNMRTLESWKDALERVQEFLKLEGNPHNIIPVDDEEYTKHQRIYDASLIKFRIEGAEDMASYVFKRKVPNGKPKPATRTPEHDNFFSQLLTTTQTTSDRYHPLIDGQNESNVPTRITISFSQEGETSPPLNDWKKCLELLTTAENQGLEAWEKALNSAAQFLKNEREIADINNDDELLIEHGQHEEIYDESRERFGVAFSKTMSAHNTESPSVPLLDYLSTGRKCTEPMDPPLTHVELTWDKCKELLLAAEMAYGINHKLEPWEDALNKTQVFLRSEEEKSRDILADKNSRNVYEAHKIIYDDSNQRFKANKTANLKPRPNKTTQAQETLHSETVPALSTQAKRQNNIPREEDADKKYFATEKREPSCWARLFKCCQPKDDRNDIDLSFDADKAGHYKAPEM